MSLQVMECTGEIEAILLHAQWGHPNIRFPGQYFDEETGLHYNRFRYYDPSVGRYISADPIGQAGGVNVFGYAVNNPVGAIDPFGLDPTSTDIEGCRLCDISPEFQETLTLEAAAMGRLSGTLSLFGGAPPFVCDLFEKNCLSSGVLTGTCPPESEVGEFCKNLKALCAAASKNSSAEGDFDDGGLGASKDRQGRTSITDIFSGGRAKTEP
jgi:RHS repeat-associated protein